MKHTLAGAVCAALWLAAGGVAHAAPAQGGVTFTLLRDGMPAGEERVTARRTPGGTTLTTRMSLSAGPGVELHAALALRPDGTPRALDASGKSFGWYPAPAAWRPATAARGTRVFPATSPFPTSHLGALVGYGKRAGNPALVSPSGAAIGIHPCGRDTVRADGRAHVLDCTEISGLGWGRSIVWTERSGEMAAAYVPTLVGKVQALAPAYRASGEQFMRLAAGAATRLARRTRPLASSRERPVVLRGGTVLDVATGERLRDAVVVLRDGRIAVVGAAGSVAVPEGARVLDARGATLLPGLWDMHAHIRQVEWGPAYLAAGVTTARDLGNDLAFATTLQRIFRAPGPAGPELLLAGWVDATDATAYGAYQANTPEEGRALVRRYHGAGYPQIKVWEYLAPEVMAAVIEEAHRRGMTVTGHVPASLGLLRALDLGLDQVNHLPPLLAMLGDGGAGMTPDSLARLLRARGTVVDPTLVVREFAYRRLGEPLGALEPGVAHVTPDLARGWQMLRGDPRRSREGEAEFAKGLAMVRALHAAGVPIVAGSDQGIPGYTLLRELELYVQAGLTPLDAIRSATLVPARVTGLGDEAGRVAPGLRADLLVVEGDPLADIRALRNGRWVVRNGEVYDPAALRRAIGFRP